MTNEDGRKFVLSRMNQCADSAALRRVWESLADAYKRDPIIQKAKDDLKKALSE